ncbi:Glutathione-dependent formaldehyde-activating enzyme/centromere protein V [Penicillium italicum]|uniref:Glutathione-dependent formaldehyde-activating enzyme/centromere protein V n=1 Tax=Penicillium italicum TaxID=40296 RepID=A0A0A2L757_PENIT|nr:Glutathione-dependent formaldehyde-activating enzyme/centromere protein V [Penicillium italicum]
MTLNFSAMAQKYLTGACLCKNIVYRIMLSASESFPKVIICHCTNCKRYTGSSFSANIIVPQPSLEYIKGSPKLYSDRSDKGGQVLREFCPDCGTPFTSRSSDDNEVVAVKSGTLDEEHRLNCAKLEMEIYYHRKDKWVDDMGNEDVPRVNGSMGG